MKQSQRRELVSGADVVYIYHNTIDAVGDKANTEHQVFEACADALEELKNLVRLIVNSMSGSKILITADHGFLYAHEPLTESEKSAQVLFPEMSLKAEDGISSQTMPANQNPSCVFRWKNMRMDWLDSHHLKRFAFKSSCGGSHLSMAAYRCRNAVCQ